MPLYASSSATPEGSQLSDENNGSGLFSSTLLFLILIVAAGIFVYKLRQKKMKEKNDEKGFNEDQIEEREKDE